MFNFKRKQLSEPDETNNYENNNYFADEPKEQPFKIFVVETVRIILFVLIIVLPIRLFVIQPFRVSGESMETTFHHGEYLIVDQISYRFTEPSYGEVIVFRYPEDPTIPFIKRVVGVPGDHLQYKDKSLTINGVEVDLELKGIYRSNGVGKRENGSYRLAEKLGERDHDILINPLQPSSVVVDREIPEGHYFVLGDNRDNSRDSRYWGLVPDENLVGRAFYIWMNWSNDSIFDLGSWDVDWDRIGSDIN